MKKNDEISEKKFELFDIEDNIENPELLGLKGDVAYTRATRIIWITSIFLTIFFTWSYFGEISEVVYGTGTVIPSQKEQVIQSLDGGILKKINVKEGDIVAAGQIVAEFDTIRTQSSMQESQAKYNAALAASVRLKTEVDNGSITSLIFPEELSKYPNLISREKQLFINKKNKLNEIISGIKKAEKLINKELAIHQELLKKGASSEVDVLRLQRQLVEMQSKEEDIIQEYSLNASQELAKVNSEVQSLRQVITGRNDLIDKSKIKSPVQGIVKNIIISTIGGVVPPNGILMNVVPINDKLLIEARISPRDIAFIHARPVINNSDNVVPNQKVKVKITAYDYSIYGGLDGEVTVISPDSIKDEHNPNKYYYRVYIETDRDYVKTKSGNKMYISPGMMAIIEINTGSRTIFQYLVKPFNKLNEALRER